jgi:hypothetical protein
MFAVYTALDNFQFPFLQTRNPSLHACCEEKGEQGGENDLEIGKWDTSADSKSSPWYDALRGGKEFHTDCFPLGGQQVSVIVFNEKGKAQWEQHPWA